MEKRKAHNYWEEKIFDGKNLEEHLLGRKIGIWGTGKSAQGAFRILDKIGRKDYYYFDNNPEKWNDSFNGKRILNPKIIDKDWYIFIFSNFYPEISRQLERYGLSKINDFVDAKQIEFYIYNEKYKNVMRVPPVTTRMLEEIVEELKKYHITTEQIEWLNEEEIIKFEEILHFQKEYNKATNSRYKRKIEEYFIVNRLLELDDYGEKDKYIDIGACSSPFAEYLRNNGVEAYAIDLDASPYPYEYYRQEDAANTSFPDQSVRGASAQSAFEMFSGNADMGLIKELSRILETGGKAVLLPLYLHQKYLSAVSPIYYRCGNADEESTECIRADCGNAIPFARFYDVCHLKRRILDLADKVGLRSKIYIIPNEFIELDQFVYLKFVLELTKA